MKALILNSGMGKRMGVLTKNHPKCMTTIEGGDTILSRQLKILSTLGIRDIVITTGYFDKILIDYCSLLPYKNLNIKFVKNPMFDKTNYIYSIYCARNYLDDDIVLMHGDLVFDINVLDSMIKSEHSCMKVSSTIPLPEKDFKAVIEKGLIKKVGVEFFDHAMEAQALYFLKRHNWKIWLSKIIEFCENGQTDCYAENALNEVSDNCNIRPYDAKNDLCTEIDNVEDLNKVNEKLRNKQQ